MNPALSFVFEKQVQRTLDALHANNMDAWYLATAAEVVPFVEKMIPEGSVVSHGGSMTLSETGVLDLLASGQYDYLDRSKVPPEEADALYRRVFSADWYLSSANAVTEAGEVYNVDATANRISAIAFGPSNVLLIVGRNKLVADLAAAERRMKEVTAPANAVRLGRKTPCAVTGRCADCHSPDRICCSTLVLRQQAKKGRIKVLIVGEELGF